MKFFPHSKFPEKKSSMAANDFFVINCLAKIFQKNIRIDLFISSSEKRAKGAMTNYTNYPAVATTYCI